MYACLCRGVSERKVKASIRRGARTVEEIADACGAGSRCGGCWPLLDDLLAECATGDRIPVGAGGAIGAITPPVATA